MSRIPKILHYCFGMAPDFGGKPWSLIHYACLRSAIEHIRPEAVRFYYHHEPSGPWWEATKPLVELVRIDPPTEIFGNSVSLPAHRADVVRLEQLIAQGGIYLDADALVLRSFDPLLDASTVLGVENLGPETGLANAVILAEPGAPFLKRWYEEYRWFRGDEGYWNEHSVKVPAQLARRHRDELTVLPFTAFYWPLWTEEHLAWIFDGADPVGADNAFVRHLWESQAWGRVAGLTPGMVRARETNFCRWVRPYVADLPDDYGATGEAPPPPPPAPAPAPKPPAATGRKEMFQKIYAGAQWGGEGGGAFFSGVGSRGAAADRYVTAMIRKLHRLHRKFGRDMVVVDIGCGDFAIGRQLVEGCPFIRYVGCDIVPELVDHLQARFGSDRVSFQTLDIVTEAPPPGDICLVRQVFQHLPNRDVLAALPRLRGFAAVYITEGQPAVRHGPPNPDKPLDSSVRFDWQRGIGRGIEWREAPFSLKAKEIARAFAPPYEIIVTERVWVR